LTPLLLPLPSRTCAAAQLLLPPLLLPLLLLPRGIVGCRCCRLLYRGGVIHELLLLQLIGGRVGVYLRGRLTMRAVAAAASAAAPYLQYKHNWC
jgi:hypothetical protein